VGQDEEYDQGQDRPQQRHFFGSFLASWSFDEEITTIPYFITYAGPYSKSIGARERG
jgi:hypothetical protein